MKRYASIDFLRGFSIFMMVIFHVIMRWYDRTWMEQGQFEGAPLLFVLAYALVVFFSAWAGFFLMVSAVGNMISMHRTLGRGHSWKRLIVFQVVGGLLLLVAAILVESTIGYHGYLGEAVKGNFDQWHMILWRGYHMETIHTIALCVVVNGVVQGLLSIKEGWKKARRNKIIYGLLAVGTVALTGPVWAVLKKIIPGYPVEMWFSELAGMELEVQYAVLGESSLGEVVLKAVLLPFGGLPEPLFPFLALSFVGSIVGVSLCEQRSDKKMPERGMALGGLLFLAGAVGTVLVIEMGRSEAGTLLQYFFQIPGLYPSLWFWWFLCLSGGQIFVLLVFLRLVEYRGKGPAFGARTLMIRRYGYVAFTIYIYQFIDVLPRALYQVFPGLAATYPYPDKVSVPMVLALIPLTVLLWEAVLRAWEKLEFVGGMEWCIAKVVETLLPGRRKARGGKKRWWQVSRLDARAYLYDPEWLNVVEEKQVDHQALEESKLAFKLSLGSLVVFPLSIPGLLVARASRRQEGLNPYNRRARVLGAVSVAFYAVLIGVLLVLRTPNFQAL